MKITFDPTSQEDIDAVRAVLKASGFTSAPTALAMLDDVPTEAELAAQSPAASIAAKILNGGQEAVERDIAAGVAADAAPMTELDVNGTPWIAEVHAGTRSKKTDGTWTKRRGVSDDDLEAAEAAAREGIAAVQTAVDEAPTPPVTLPEPTAAPVSLEDLNNRYAEALAGGQIDNTKIDDWYTRHGIDPSVFSTDETMRAKTLTLLNDETALAELSPTPAQPVMPGMPGA